MRINKERPGHHGGRGQPESAATVNGRSDDPTTTILSEHDRGSVSARDDVDEKATNTVSVTIEQRNGAQVGSVIDPPRRPLAWARVFPDTLLAHILPLSDLATAAWVRFWCHYLNQGQPVKDEAVVLARVCAMTPRQWEKVRKEWVDQGVVQLVDGLLRDPFIQSQIDHCWQKSKTNQSNANRRWKGRVEDAP